MISRKNRKGKINSKQTIEYLCKQACLGNVLLIEITDLKKDRLEEK